MVDERLPVIWEKGVKTFGDEDMMKTMVQNFEPMSFDSVMKDLANEIQNENWPEVKRHAHTMKGSSSYIGADRFSEVCLLLQNAAMGDNIPEIYSTYEKVLKEGKILKNYLAKLLEKTPDTTEVDNYILALEKIKKTKKVNSNSSKEKEKPEKNQKPVADAHTQKKEEINTKDKKPNNTEKTEKPNKKVKIEGNQESKEALNIDKKPKIENGASKPQMGILESADPSADKACCKQCIIF